MTSEPSHFFVLGQRVDVTSYAHAAEVILQWSRERAGKYVCISNVHMVMEGRDDPEFRRIVNDADLITPDGMPLVWAMRIGGIDNAVRVRGPDLMPHLLAEAERQDIPIGFFGGSEETLQRLVDVVRERFPRLRVAYSYSPPFRQPSAAEDDAIVEAIRDSGARVLFVGLGCPKQERWMATHRSRLDAVLVGVGAAFDFMAGSKAESPRWMQDAGLEWLFRLASEPRRLWRRYLVHNSRFVALFARELVRGRTR